MHLWLACNRLCGSLLQPTCIGFNCFNGSLAQVLYEYTDEELRETLKALVLLLLVI